MKKQILVIAIVLILVVIGLCGCSEKPKEDSKVVEETKNLTSRTKRGKMEETKKVATDTE